MHDLRPPANSAFSPDDTAPTAPTVPSEADPTSPAPLDDRRLQLPDIRSSRDLEQLARIAIGHIYRAEPLRASLDEIVRVLRALLNCDRAIVWKFSDSSGADGAATDGAASSVRVAVPWAEATADPWPSFTSRGERIAVEADPLWQSLEAIAKDDTATCRTEVLQAVAFAPSHCTVFAVRSRAVMPIFVRDIRGCVVLWGAIAAHHCRTARPWSPRKCSYLEYLASPIALAIQHDALQESLRVQAAAFERRTYEEAIRFQQAIDYDATLKRITDKVRDSLDEKQIVQNAVREVAHALQVGSCNAAIYDRDRRTSQILYEETIFLPAQIYRESDMSAFPELYDQLLDKQYFQFCSMSERNVDRENCALKGRVAMLACSMFDNDGVIGDLWVVHDCQHEFTDLEVRLVCQVANQCAIAIRQARLYQASQAQVAELEKLNQLKDDFLSTVSHELKTPVSNINMAIQMLEIQIDRFETTEETRARIARYLGILKDECKREDELITDLLDLQRLEGGDYSAALSVIDFEKWLQRTIAGTRTRLSSRQQTLTIEAEALPQLITDRVILDRIIVELLNNAGKYSANGSTINLRVTEADCSELGVASGIRLCVTNPATIPASELPKIFSKFYRIPNADPWKQGGTGLGLALVDRLVRQLGGSLSAVSENGTTTFSVLIPNHKNRLEMPE